MKISKQELKRFIAYCLRWQLSSPILAICLIWLDDLGTFWATIIANFVGACIFFWVDKIIFKDKNEKETKQTHR